MDTLDDILQRRTWRDLRAIAGAYHVLFSGKKTRAEEARRLVKLLFEDGLVQRAFRQLTSAERDPLVALQAAGGELPSAQFTAAFGQIRPYRPWRDHLSHPWKQPLSVAEKLWYLALIDIHDETVVIPAEVLAMLPPLPIVPLRPAPPIQALAAPALVVDVALLLGVLLHKDVAPGWGRWLQPSVLKQLNSMFRIPDATATPRSEFYTYRTRFIHYLADITGLISVQQGYLKPTSAAWTWLDLTPDRQWQHLFENIVCDLEQRQSLWERYKMPPITARIWQETTQLLRTLNPGESYDAAFFISALRPHLPGVSLASIPPLLEGAISWLGIVSVCADETIQFHGLPPDIPRPEPANLCVSLPGSDELIVRLPWFPRTRPLIELMAWALPDGTALRINKEVAHRAYVGHHNAAQVTGLLAQMVDEHVPQDWIGLINQWERAAGRLTLDRHIILSSADTDLLVALMADRYMRKMLEGPLSAHHIIVKPHAVDQFVQRLRRRKLLIADQRPQIELNEGRSAGIDSQTAAYLWLAARVYQGLEGLVPAPVHIPGAVLDWLETQFAPDQQADLSKAADAFLTDVIDTTANDNFKLHSLPVSQTNLTAIRTRIEQAVVARAALTIDYFSPARGMITRRTIEPLMPIVQRGDFAYVQAYCREVEEERTFRLDRIACIVDSST